MVFATPEIQMKMARPRNPNEERMKSFQEKIAQDPKNTRLLIEYFKFLIHSKELDEAETILNTLEKFSPNLPDNHSNRGLIYLERKEYEKAGPHIEQAINMAKQQPQTPAASLVSIYNNYIIYLKETGRNKEIGTYAPILLSHDYTRLQSWVILGSFYLSYDHKDELFDIVKQAEEHEDTSTLIKVTMNVFLAWWYYLNVPGYDYEHLIPDLKIPKPSAKDQEAVRNTIIFRNYLERLLENRKTISEHIAAAPLEDLNKAIFFIGDSHSMPPVHMNIETHDGTKQVVTNMATGAKAFHISRNSNNQYKENFLWRINQLPDNSIVCLSAGEIDCRTRQSGFIQRVRKNPKTDIDQLIKDVAHGYVDNCMEVIKKKKIKAFFMNVLAPTIREQNILHPDYRLQIQVVRKFNEALEEACAQYDNVDIIDVYAPTVNPQGMNNDKWNVDFYHLKPMLYKQLLEEKLS